MKLCFGKLSRAEREPLAHRAKISTRNYASALASLTLRCDAGCAFKGSWRGSSGISRVGVLNFFTSHLCSTLITQMKKRRVEQRSVKRTTANTYWPFQFVRGDLCGSYFYLIFLSCWKGFFSQSHRGHCRDDLTVLLAHG